MTDTKRMWKPGQGRSPFQAPVAGELCCWCDEPAVLFGADYRGASTLYEPACQEHADIHLPYLGADRSVLVMPKAGEES